MFALSPHPPAFLIDPFTAFLQQVPQDFRPGNPERPFWQAWHYTLSLYGFRCTSEEYQHDKCWGWTILRTSYDDDEEFTRAVDAIQRLGLVRLEDEYRESRTRGKPDDDDANTAMEKLDQVPGRPPTFHEGTQQYWSDMVGPARGALPEGEPLTPDWVITHELVRRYHNLIVQDREALDGADASKAWKYAHAMNLEDREQGARGELFIYLDKESIHHLARAPSQEELAGMAPLDRRRTAWTFWVKVVSTICQVTDDGDDMDQMMEAPMARRRIRLYDLFETFIHLCDGSVDELLYEGTRRERYVQPGDWGFCTNRFASSSFEPWLGEQELYGEVVRMY